MVAQSLGAWAPAIVTFAAVMLGTLALALLWQWWIERGRRRDVVEQLRSFAARSSGDQAASRTLIRGVKTVEARWLQSVAARVPQLRDLANLLGQAGIRWSARGYLLITLGVALGLGFAAFMVLRLWAAALVAASAGACLPYLYLRRRKMRFIRTFEEQLPEAIDLLGRALRAGHPLSAGLKMAADQPPEPAAGAFAPGSEGSDFAIPSKTSLLDWPTRSTWSASRSRVRPSPF